MKITYICKNQPEHKWMQHAILSFSVMWHSYCTSYPGRESDKIMLLQSIESALFATLLWVWASSALLWKYLSQLVQSVHSNVSTLLRITLSARRHKKDQSTNDKGHFVPLSSCSFLKYSPKHIQFICNISLWTVEGLSQSWCKLIITHSTGTHSSTSCLICKTSHWSLLALPHACLLPSQVWFISWHVTILHIKTNNTSSN